MDELTEYLGNIEIVGRCTVAEPALEMDPTFPFTVAEGGGI
jgi:hypothetical protein